MLAADILLTVLDSIAAGVDVLEAATGIDGSEFGTIGQAAASNRDLLAALDDTAIAEDLGGGFARRARGVLADRFYPLLQGASIQYALDRHYGGDAGSLNRFLAAHDLRVHPNLRLIGMQIDARNVFRPTVLDPVATYEGTGAEAGTFAAGSDIDTSLYGPASMDVLVVNMGAANRTLALTLKKWDGSTEIRAVDVLANAIAGTVLAIGEAGDRYIGVTGISTTAGGLAGDSVHVRSTIERAIAL